LLIGGRVRKVLLENTSLKLSRFGFGTSRLFNVASPQLRQRLLASAYDYGMTHFDTAPLYGFGVAERELKSVLATHPDATVATKVGLYPPGGADKHDFSVFFRKAAGKLVPVFSKAVVDWSVDRARKSLDGSLRRLGRTRIDLYLLHEPEAHLLATDEWLSWLESERGRVAAFGIAADAAKLPAFLIGGHPLARIVQCSDSIADTEADVLIRAGFPLQITYGYITSAKRDPKADIEAALAAALRRNSKGCILVSTSKEERIRRLAELVEKYDDRANSPSIDSFAHSQRS
jgi:aryl-alcohol dehydrogenase-like predicted oxidoreductase